MGKLDKVNFDRITPLMELIVLLIPFVGAYLVIIVVFIGKYGKLHLNMKRKRIRLFLSIYLTMLVGFTVGFTLTKLVNDTIFGIDSEKLIPILFWALSLIIWELTFYKKFKKQSADNDTAPKGKNASGSQRIWRIAMRKFDLNRITLYLEPILLLIPIWGAIIVMGTICIKFCLLIRANENKKNRIFLSFTGVVFIGAILAATSLMFIIYRWPDAGNNVTAIPMTFFLALSCYIWELIFYRKYKNYSKNKADTEINE